MTTSMRVDMVRCAAHGICAHVFPEQVGLDPWGFPVVEQAELRSRRALNRARRAERACPARAVVLVPLEPAPPANPS